MAVNLRQPRATSLRVVWQLRAKSAPPRLSTVVVAGRRVKVEEIVALLEA
jgi:hypothetical protein